MTDLNTQFGDTTAGKILKRTVTVTSTAASEVAGMRTRDINFCAGSQFGIISRGPALAEVSVNGHFVLMYRRKDSMGLHSGYADRMFWVTDENYEMTVMRHEELVSKINQLAARAD